MQCEYVRADKTKCDIKELSTVPNKCIFHAALGDKGNYAGERITGIIKILIARKRELDFQGAIFPPGTRIIGKDVHTAMDLSGAEFHGEEGILGFVAKGVNFKGRLILHKAKVRSGGLKFDNCSFAQIDAFGLEVYGGRVDFENKCVFTDDVWFAKAYFRENASFSDSEFSGRRIDFSEANFEGKYAAFVRCKFDLNKVRLIFFRTKFNTDITIFTGSKFIGANPVEFGETKFLSGLTLFEDTIFEGCDVSFLGAKFGQGKIQFLGTSFSNNVSFIRNRIDGELVISGITLGESSNFTFDSPIFIKRTNIPPLIIFEKISFVPFKTFFDGFKAKKIKYDMVEDIKFEFAVIFRYCNLHSISFSDCTMSLFSFFRSYFFEESFIESPKWISQKESIIAPFDWPDFERKSLIFEDIYKNKSNTEPHSTLSKEFRLEKLEDQWEIANLYRRFKASADKAKNYHMASWFYFNEFEMKNLELKTKAGSRGMLRRLQYYTYKLFTGYGEKPIWTTIWLANFLFLFTGLHLWNGVKISGDRITYIFGTDQWPGWYTFLHNIFFTILLTFSRILPSNFIPSNTKYMLPTDDGLDIFLSWSNTVVLVILAVFIGIGLKRHFRRF